MKIKLSDNRTYILVDAEEPERCHGCVFEYDYKLCSEATRKQDCFDLIYIEAPMKETMNSEKKPHKHADIIKAWADGHPIQVYDTDAFMWCDDPQPEWFGNRDYRIKPEEKKPVVRWMWAEKMVGIDQKFIGWSYSNMFASEQEAEEWFQGYQVIKLEWTETEFPE